MSGCLLMAGLGFLGLLVAGPFGLIVGVIAGGFVSVAGKK